MKIPRIRWGTGCLLLLSGILHGQQVEIAKCTDLTPQQVKAKLDSAEQIVLVDVRTPEEYTSEVGHIPGAMLFPFRYLVQRFEEIEKIKDREIIVYCLSGGRSQRAAEFLASKGIAAKNMTGGMREWNRLGYPVSRENPENGTSSKKIQ